MMIVKNSIVLFLFAIFLIRENLFPQTYTDDSLIVRAILDSNGLFNFPVDSITDSSNGRITYFHSYGAINLTNLPSAIGKLNKLKKLDLYNDKITSLPKETGNLIELDTLMIYISKITSIPEEIGNLASLRMLDLTTNDQLTSIPSQIGNLANLEILRLVDNELTMIPSAIGNLQKLKEIYMNLLHE